MYCPMTKTSARGGFDKTRPANNVKTIESKYISDARKRPRSNIFCNCLKGPIKKHVPTSDRILPKDIITVKPVIFHVKSKALPAKEHIIDRQRQPRKHCNRRSQDNDETKWFSEVSSVGGEFDKFDISAFSSSPNNL